MKKLKTLLTTLLIVTLVLGTTMTAFAKEAEVSFVGSAQSANKSIDVNVGYSRAKIAGTDKDQTGQDIYNIVIDYEDLNFSYEAESILWDPAAGEYVVTLTDESKNQSEKPIQITNRSTKAVLMSASISSVGTTNGFDCDIVLSDKDTGNETRLDAAYKNPQATVAFSDKALDINDAKRLGVAVKVNSISSDVSTFNMSGIGSIDLMFKPATTSTGGGPSHTGGID